jgi:Icc-related predicted phosphoesterase
MMRIYFCSDVHASERCWKKFLNSADFYEADVIIMGGDLTGKFIVPIIERGAGRYSASFLGVERIIEDKEALSALTKRIADAGQYAFITSPDEQNWLAEDQSRVDDLFTKLALERVDNWISQAEDRFKHSKVRVFASAANDDDLEVDTLLKKSSIVQDPNGDVVDLGNGYHIMGMGWGNPTPWNCPRDTSEEDLSRRIDAAAAALSDPQKTIFNLHVPPLDSGLDLAPRLDGDLRPVIDGSGSEMVGVGSTATRDAIIKYQPLLGLHGHIHESKGVRKLNGVPIANPGSEYGEGILNGLLIELHQKRGITNIQQVTG